ncbi:hypothetical protein BGX30_004563, partial [Mortierella sp. GBA39]
MADHNNNNHNTSSSGAPPPPPSHPPLTHVATSSSIASTLTNNNNAPPSSSTSTDSTSSSTLSLAINTNIINNTHNPTAHDSTSPSAAARTAETTNGNANASSGFSLPASNPFTDHNDPLNPFSPAQTPMVTPLGSPTSELRKLNLGVERYARAIEDNGPMGSFSGVVPLPSLSQSHPIASKRRPSHILLDKLSPVPFNDPSMLSPHHDGTAAEATGRSTGLNLSSIKRAISGKKRSQDMNMIDLESNSYASSSQHDANTTSNSNNLNHRRGSLFKDLSNPFATSTSNSNMDAQVALMESLSYSPQPMLLPTMPGPTALQEGPNESRTSGGGGDEIRRRFEQSNGNSGATTTSGMRRRKPKGGILSQLLKLQRNEAAAAAAASSSSTANPSGSRRSATQPGSALHAAVKKTKKGFYYRSSSKNNSSADLASPSVTTTPKVSPRNSKVFDLDPLAPMATITRLPTQPSTSINNNASPFTRSNPQHHHENMEEMEAISAAATAATLNANLGIQRDIAEILTRQSFLIMIAKALILYGAPSHRIEETCALLARKMEVDASFALLPGLMTISFSDPETHTSDTRHLRCTQGMDMYKLSKVYKIAWGVLHGKGVEEANRALERVTIEPGYYPVWVTVMSWMTTAAFVAPLAFNGSWLDTALAGLCGLVVGLLGVVAAKFPVYGNVFEVTSSILVGFIARSFGDRVCFAAVALAGVVILLPGLLLTQAIMELASRNIVSGSVRMFYALMYAFFLGYGLSL